MVAPRLAKSLGVSLYREISIRQVDLERAIRYIAAGCQKSRDDIGTGVLHKRVVTGLLQEVFEESQYHGI